MRKSILIMLIFTFTLFSFVSASCFDSDGGKNKYTFGGVTDNQGATYQDVCDNQNIKEYFCSIDGVASYTLLQCVNGCENGECQLANNAPLKQSPVKEPSTIKLYLYGAIILLTILLYLSWFKFGKKKKRYSG